MLMQIYSQLNLNIMQNSQNIHGNLKLQCVKKVKNQVFLSSVIIFDPLGF